MKSSNDLRLEFKRETGLSVDSGIGDALEAFEALKDGSVEHIKGNLEHLEAEISDIDTMFDDNEYIKWLEEKLIEKWTVI
jgi:hypothetical protein